MRVSKPLRCSHRNLSARRTVSNSQSWPYAPTISRPRNWRQRSTTALTWVDWTTQHVTHTNSNMGRTTSCSRRKSNQPRTRPLHPFQWVRNHAPTKTVPRWERRRSKARLTCPNFCLPRPYNSKKITVRMVVVIGTINIISVLIQWTTGRHLPKSWMLSSATCLSATRTQLPSRPSNHKGRIRPRSPPKWHPKSNLFC